MSEVEERRLQNDQLSGLPAILRIVLIVCVCTEIASVAVGGIGHGASMIRTVFSGELSALGALTLGGSSWLVLTIAGMWPTKFQRITLALFFLALIAAVYARMSGLTQVLNTTASVLSAAVFLPSAVSIVYTLSDALRRRAASGHTKIFWQLAVFFVAMGVMTVNGLQLNLLLFPLAFDAVAYRIDTFVGPSLPVGFAQYLANNRAVEALTRASYDLIGYVVALFVGIVMRARLAVPMNLWRYAVWPYLTAWVCYGLLPIAGPLYAYNKVFPALMPDPSTVQLTAQVFGPAYRNGMPSMHLSAAILLLLAAICVRNRLAVGFAVPFVLITAWATLALGEHYLIDLIVALPFAAALGAVLLYPRCLLQPARLRSLVFACVSIYALWILLLRFAAPFLDANHWVLWALTLMSVVFAVLTFYGLVVRMWAVNSAYLKDPQAFDASPILISNEVAKTKTPTWVFAVFFASGFAGLVYEVVFSKALALSFGSTALANYTVLATYMGGMAIGAWLGGLWASRTERPLHAYAVCELLIGVYAVLTPLLFSVMQGTYVALSSGLASDAASLTPMRIALGALTLGIPTVLMGMTLPLMLKHVRTGGAASGESIARLYGANVVGAAVGSFVGGYFILPAAGKNGSTLLAAVLSLLIALYAFKRAKSLSNSVAQSSFAQVTGGSGKYLPPPDTAPSAWTNAMFVTSLIVLGVGGTLTLALEVVYIHLLAVVAGNSVYAFALMLAAFLCGLGLGAEATRRLVARHSSTFWIIVVAEFGLAGAIALTTHLWDGIPTYFGSYASYIPDLGFSARETIRAFVCFVAMLPSAFFIGMAYPVAMDIASQRLSNDVNKGIGGAAMLNTFGNIAGVFVGGFWLLPWLGSLGTIKVLSFAAFAMGGLALVALWSSIPRRSFAWAVSGGVAVAAIVAVQPTSFNMERLTNGANVYFAPQQWGTYVEHIDSVDGGLTSVSQASNNMHTLLTNGKFQGNNADQGEMVAQVGFAIAPLLHTVERESALVIGYGTGVTSRVLHDAGFATLDVAELSGDIVKLADKYFENVNKHVLQKPGVHLHVTDGRNFLLTQDRAYDLVSMEVSSIWFAGAANLYNRELYQLVRKRLKPNGILQQWVQLHHISAVDIAYVLGSVRSEFKYVWLYVIGGQGIIVASNDVGAERSQAKVDRLLATKNLQTVLGLYNNHPEDAAKGLMLGPLDVDRLITKFDPTMQRMVSTDNNLYLEYSTPKGNAITRSTTQSSIDALRAAAGITK